MTGLNRNECKKEILSKKMGVKKKFLGKKRKVQYKFDKILGRQTFVPKRMINHKDLGKKKMLVKDILA